MISDRTRSGLEAARARGVRLGRPPKLSPHQIEAIRQGRLHGSSVRALADHHQVHPETIRRLVR
ncbi:MAG: helix-turn-helix domain-containing protein [Rhodospirillaceae bacterium]